MDEQEVAAELRELVEIARLDFPSALDGARIDEPYGDTAGFVLAFPRGRFLVTVAQIGE